MINPDLLYVIVRVEVALLVLSVGLFFIHGAWLFLVGSRLSRQAATGREALLGALQRATARSDPDDVRRISEFPETATLRALNTNIATTIFLDVARSVTGAGSGVIRELALETGITRKARKLCRSRRWSRRLIGARILTQLNEQDPIVAKLLRDEYAPVRAQAAEWAALTRSPQLISDMLELLGDPDTLSRFAVQDALLRMGSEVVAPLSRYIAAHTGAAAEAGMKIASARPDLAFLANAEHFSSDADPALRIQSSRLLGAIGGEAAASRLIEMLADTDLDVQAEAVRALGRMRHWQAATKIASVLGSAAWKARYAAGLALRSIGGPGTLLLRKALLGPDRLASEMAELVLGLPDAAR